MQDTNRKILLVDDEKILRDGFKFAVDWEKNGYVIVGEASNGKEALRECALKAPDIVITDIVMPVMDGIELIKKLREEYPHIKVLVLTCHSEFSYAREAFRFGAIDYFLKFSVNYDDLLEKLHFNERDEPISAAKPDSADTQEALKHTFYRDTENILSIHSAKKPFSLQNSDFDCKELATHIQNSDFQQIDKFVEHVCHIIFEQHLHPEHAREIFINMMSYGIRVLNSYGLSVNDLYHNNSTPYTEILKFETLKDIKGYVLDFFKLLLKSTEEQHTVKYRKEIADVILYIKKNYNRDITLKTISEEVNYSFNYLSQIFKEQVGENFTDFLIRIRMDRAKLLLRDTNLKIYEIAGQVGYTDSSYFCRLFKKIEGLNPVEYREKFSISQS